MNAAEKARMAREAQKKAEEQKKKNSFKFFKDDYKNWDVLGIFLGIVFTAVSGVMVFSVLKIINGLSGYDTAALKDAKLALLLGAIGMVLTIVLSIVTIKYGRSADDYYYDGYGNRIESYRYQYWNESHVHRIYSRSSLFISIFSILNTIVSGILSVVYIVLLIMFLSRGRLGIKQFIVAEQDGVVYTLRKDGYELECVYNNAEHIIIRANSRYATITEIDKKLFKGNNTLKSIEFADGNLKIGKEAFADCINLEVVTFGNYSYTMEKNVFENCLSVKEVILNQSTISVDGNTDNNIENYQVFSKLPNATLNVNGARWNHYKEEFGTLILDNTAYLDQWYSVDNPSQLRKHTNVVVLNEGFNFNESCLKYYSKTWKFSFSDSHPEDLWLYYSFGQTIYIPASVTSIPDYFFGDNLFDNTKVKVYFAGTEEEWNNIVIGSVGNSNYTNNNVVVEYNTTYTK